MTFYSVISSWQHQSQIYSVHNNFQFHKLFLNCTSKTSVFTLSRIMKGQVDPTSFQAIFSSLAKIRSFAEKILKRVTRNYSKKIRNGVPLESKATQGFELSKDWGDSKIIQWKFFQNFKTFQWFGLIHFEVLLDSSVQQNSEQNKNYKFPMA